MNVEKLAERAAKKFPNDDSFAITSHVLWAIAKRRARAASMDLKDYLRIHKFTVEETREVSGVVEKVLARVAKCSTGAQESTKIFYQRLIDSADAKISRTTGESLFSSPS